MTQIESRFNQSEREGAELSRRINETMSSLTSGLLRTPEFVDYAARKYVNGSPTQLGHEVVPATFEKGDHRYSVNFTNQHVDLNHYGVEENRRKYLEIKKFNTDGDYLIAVVSFIS